MNLDNAKALQWNRARSTLPGDVFPIMDGFVHQVSIEEGTTLRMQVVERSGRLDVVCAPTLTDKELTRYLTEAFRAFRTLRGMRMARGPKNPSCLAPFYWDNIIGVATVKEGAAKTRERMLLAQREAEAQKLTPEMMIRRKLAHLDRGGSTHQNALDAIIDLALAGEHISRAE